MPTRKGARQVCVGSVRVDKAGKSSVSCRLSAVARRRLRSRDLRLHVVVGFAPQVGEREVIEGNDSVAALPRAN
jgi:hypothetical protein